MPSITCVGATTAVFPLRTGKQRSLGSAVGEGEHHSELDNAGLPEDAGMWKRVIRPRRNDPMMTTPDFLGSSLFSVGSMTSQSSVS